MKRFDLFLINNIWVISCKDCFAPIDQEYINAYKSIGEEYFQTISAYATFQSVLPMKGGSDKRI